MTSPYKPEPAADVLTVAQYAKTYGDGEVWTAACRLLGQAWPCIACGEPVRIAERDWDGTQAPLRPLHFGCA